MRLCGKFGVNHDFVLLKIEYWILRIIKKPETFEEFRARSDSLA
ncbi:hypothetical protein GXM_06265 [Nostoc sphaeroides CCNUC1]|uniref:Uncharacterized protein n=1 Tax=Nostoc sphaeroides CCNUC1 TaxID=2653204 RepID=A0A5P8W884_9NOSO|nr:hypothetical protein GXM_06265 [Nostoc sphaeroides CCNUC1]